MKLRLRKSSSLTRKEICLPTGIKRDCSLTQTCTIGVVEMYVSNPSHPPSPALPHSLLFPHTQLFPVGSVHLCECVAQKRERFTFKPLSGITAATQKTNIPALRSIRCIYRSKLQLRNIFKPADCQIMSPSAFSSLFLWFLPTGFYLMNSAKKKKKQIFLER